MNHHEMAISPTNRPAASRATPHPTMRQRARVLASTYSRRLALNSAVTDEAWSGIVRDGGAAFGLSLDMPAFRDGATPEQLRAVVRYIRSLCSERGWPPGELNFPRAFLAEKAYPENEVVTSLHGSGQ